MNSQQQNLHVIYCVDGKCDQMIQEPNGTRQGGSKRMTHNPDHVAYQISTSSPDHPCYINKVAAVPMLADDGITMIGSCFLINAPREECERFIQADPFSVNNVWESVSITKFSTAAKALETATTSTASDPFSSNTRRHSLRC